MDCFLGIDAGGTKTVCALADGERELARVQTGSIKRLRIGAEEAYGSLHAALHQLSAAAGVPLASIVSTCVGAAGIGAPLVRNWMMEGLASLVEGKVMICGDEEIALDAAFEGKPGVLIVAGTGSNVVGRSQDGQTVNAGGWGPALADEGSGYWIGHQALRAAFRAMDEGVPSPLLARVAEHWQLTGMAQLIETANAISPPDFSQLTAIVAACAEAGDPVAVEVLDRGGKELALLALMVIRQLQKREGDSFVLPPIAMTGSILQKIASVRRSMMAALHRAHGNIEIIEDPVDPVRGALWRARAAIYPAA